MNAWLSQDRPVAALDVAPPSALRRGLDAGVALVLLFVLGLPLWLWRSRWDSEACQGLAGRPFRRWHLRPAKSTPGGWWHALAVSDWPVVWNVWRGDMAWVGHRPRREGEVAASASTVARPGVLNSWFIRQRTAVDFGLEDDADRHDLARQSLTYDLGLALRGVLWGCLSEPSRVVADRVQIADVRFDNVNMAEALDRLRLLLDGSQPAQVCFVNPACVNIAARDRGYRRLLARAALVLPDGIGIKLGSALLGSPLKQNVNGTDLFPRLCDLLQAKGARLFLMGGQAGVTDRMVAEMHQRWPRLNVVGHRHGFFAVDEEAEVVELIRASGADMVLVARGVPSQDAFIDRYLPLLGVKVAMGVGGLFDFVSGRIARAPLWMRESGLEWMWRLMQEPRRMWQRYLVGSFTFLIRVLLQRWGLRSVAVDTASEAHDQASPQVVESSRSVGGLAAVVFATTRVAPGLPVDADMPLALLPWGPDTLIEQVLTRLADAGVADVHVVVSDRPEAFNELLGDGSRWGLRLKWHWVQDPLRPYAALSGMAWGDARRVILGHAEGCPAAASLSGLIDSDGVLEPEVARGEPVLPWYSLTPQRLLSTSTAWSDMTDADWRGHRRQEWSGLFHIPQADDLKGLGSDQAVLSAQPVQDLASAWRSAPGAWVRHAWGAASPLAKIHPSARLVGPALIGPGCWVGPGVEVGPGVVLARDVVIGDGTRLTQTLVLPRSYVGPSLDLNQTIVNGTRVRHLSHGVELEVPASDAVLMSLADRASDQPIARWVGRLLACVALAVITPVLLWRLAAYRLWARPLPWRREEVVCGRAGRVGRGQGPTCWLWMTASRSSAGVARWPALGLWDIVTGRRTWLGARPRTWSQWQRLPKDWQTILAGQPLGLWHAPAWRDAHGDDAEAEAAADVHTAVLTPWQRLRLLLAIAGRQSMV